MAKMFGRTLLVHGIPAGADQSSPAASATNPITGDQFKFCKFNGSGSQVKCSVAGERGIGILQDGRASGADVEIEMLGISPLVLAGTVTEGDLIATDANAKGVAVSGGQWAGARALASGVSGDVIPVQLIPAVYIPFILLTSFHTATTLNNATVYTFTPGFAGKIASLEYGAQVASTTGAKTVNATWNIAGVPTTGGLLTIVTAAVGTPVLATAITGANTFTSAQALTLVFANATALAEGSGMILTKLFPV